MNAFGTGKLLATFVASSLLLSACEPTPVPENTTAAGEWDAFVEEFVDDYFAHHPVSAVGAGLHEYDGRMPSFAPDSIAAIADWLRAARTGAEAIELDSTDEARQFEREYLLSIVRDGLFWYDEAKVHLTNPSFYGAIDPSLYVTRDYAPLDQRMRAYTQHASAIPEATQWVRATLQTPMPATYVELGRIMFGGLATYLENDIPTIFAAVEDEATVADFRTANAAAVQALKDLDAWFEAQEASATDDYAIGAERFSRMLSETEQVETPLSELREIADADLERNLRLLTEACAAFAPGKSPVECVAQMEANKPEGGSLRGAERQMDMLRGFILENEIVTIPGEETMIARESPPHMQWNQAFADIPGPFEEGIPSIYYLSPPDTSWPEEEQLAYIPGEANLLAITVHEVWPGHFLQYLHANRANSRLGQIFVGYAFSEGWAHYVEEMIVEAGLGEGNPEVRIGQLKEALLRNVRFVTALGLHTGGMTVAEAEQLFAEKAFQDPANARQQAARGTFDPGFLNYTMGKLMIMKLRDDWTASRGGRDAWREFHDRFLSFGGPPIPLVRKAMLGEVGELF